MPDAAMYQLHFHHRLALDYFVLHGVMTTESVGYEHDDGDVVLGFKERHSIAWVTVDLGMCCSI